MSSYTRTIPTANSRRRSDLSGTPPASHSQSMSDDPFLTVTAGASSSSPAAAPTTLPKRASTQTAPSAPKPTTRDARPCANYKTNIPPLRKSSTATPTQAERHTTTFHQAPAMLSKTKAGVSSRVPHPTGAKRATASARSLIPCSQFMSIVMEFLFLCVFYFLLPRLAYAAILMVLLLPWISFKQKKAADDSSPLSKSCPCSRSMCHNAVFHAKPCPRLSPKNATSSLGRQKYMPLFVCS